MIKQCLLFSLLITVGSAQAGFLTGFVVGRATSSNGATTSSGNFTTPSGNSSTDSIAVFSDKNDVITCKQADEPGRCVNEQMMKRIVDPGRGWRNQHPTEIEYAAARGYKNILRKGVVFHAGEAWIVMEVTK